MNVDFVGIEKKWQEKWAKTGLYKFDATKPQDKKYILEMFSYPSGAKLHVGHWYNYGPVSYTHLDEYKRQTFIMGDPRGVTPSNVDQG